MSPHRSAYEALLMRVEKPGRYLGAERGVVTKSPQPGRLHFALCFPDTYEIAQSHLGLQILYDLLNRRSDVYAERVYAPWFDMESELRRAGLPLASLETFTPLRDFDIVGFTLQYELTYTNLLAMLDLGGIPLHAAARQASDPLVIAGGPCAFNPEPLADFLDAVVLGDGEDVVHEICDTVKRWDGRDRGTVLASMTAIPGVYVPAFFTPEYDERGDLLRVRPSHPGNERIRKRIVGDLNRVPMQETFIVPTMHIVHDRPSLEVMRGCVKGCRFCQAGYIYRPLRERDPRRVLEQAEHAIKQTGTPELSLLSLSTGDYSCINPLLTALMDSLAARRIAVSLPSTRVDALAPSLLEQIKRVRKTGFTLAPEAGSQRLRNLIQKQYSEADLAAAARQVFELGWRSLKLYFMLGLPTETEADLLGIVELSRRVAAEGGFRRQVTASISNFVPKPHTPFQWVRQLSIAEMEERQRLLRRELARHHIGFRWHDPRLSYLEGIISRGDRRVGRLIHRAFELGCRFDGWNDECRFDRWQQACTDTSISPEFYLRARPLDAILPWGHLDCGVTKEFLKDECTRAFDHTPTPDCSIERCSLCGVCDFTSVRNIDHHLHGAKGSDHRGRAVERWARETLGYASESQAWEPRGWHRANAQRQPVPNAATPEDPGGPATLVAPAPSEARLAAEDGTEVGNAEEWLSADDEALTPVETTQFPTARTRVRVIYTKLGRARFIGNLELTTVFHRAASRAGLPVAFTQGHHPLPRIAFGPALPVGTESDGEFVDLDLTEDVNPDWLRDRLATQLPEGISIVTACAISLREASIASRIIAFDYDIDVTALGPNSPDGQIREQLATFEGCNDYPLEKHAKGKKRLVNARPYVARIELRRPRLIAATICHGPTGTLKPADLVAAVLGLDVETARGIRVRKIATHLQGATPAEDEPANLQLRYQ